MNMNQELIFVYNANSGKWNAYMDTLHKLFSPKTYACKLCAITHGSFGMKQEWAEFIKDFPIPLRFLHKDEWAEEFNLNEKLPAVFMLKGGHIETFIGAEEMNHFDLEQLKSCIIEKLKT